MSDVLRGADHPEIPVAAEDVQDLFPVRQDDHRRVAQASLERDHSAFGGRHLADAACLGSGRRHAAAHRRTATVSVNARRYDA